MFRRGTHGLVDIPPLKDLLPMPCQNTRNFHPKKYRPLTCNTNCYMGTFYPSTANLLNALPPATLDQPNIAKFKDELDRLKKGESERVGERLSFPPFSLCLSSSLLAACQAGYLINTSLYVSSSLYAMLAFYLSLRMTISSMKFRLIFQFNYNQLSNNISG